MQNSLNASYSCLEVAESDVKSFAKLHGYAVSRARSKKSKTGEIRKVWLGCVHGGRYEKSGSGLRKTSTIKTGCTWKAVIQRVNDPEHPNLGYKWNLVVTNGEHHGHDTATDASAYTRNIALNSEQEKMVANMIKAGVSPRVILATLRQNDSGCLAVRKDKQNSKQKVVKVLSGGAHLATKTKSVHMTRSETSHSKDVDLLKLYWTCKLLHQWDTYSKTQSNQLCVAMQKWIRTNKSSYRQHWWA